MHRPLTSSPNALRRVIGSRQGVKPILSVLETSPPMPCSQLPVRRMGRAHVRCRRLAGAVPRLEGRLLEAGRRGLHRPRLRLRRPCAWNLCLTLADFDAPSYQGKDIGACCHGYSWHDHAARSDLSPAVRGFLPASCAGPGLARLILPLMCPASLGRQSHVPKCALTWCAVASMGLGH